jgi:hypothetical protein
MRLADALDTTTDAILGGRMHHHRPISPLGAV